LAWLSKYVKSDSTQTIRAVLGQMLFRQEDINKNIQNLSGGEGARLLLAKIILEAGNVLILDEPTNHLDLESKDAFKKALVNYEGTIILVTHDRDFATYVGSRIIALTHNSIIDYKGTYQEYLNKYNKDYLDDRAVIAMNKK
jgi:ATPase subunit of ABC transporter with duplicated ATPase domains